MKKFNLKIIFCIFYIFIMLSLVSSIYTDRLFDDRSSSIDSESKEVYNTSSKEKPKLRFNKISKPVDVNFIDNSTHNKLSVNRKNDGGYKVKSLADFPFSVCIQKRGSHYASGALIDKKWILTVAELFYNIRESIKLYKARLGSVNSKQGGVLVHLKGIEIHPDYVYKQPTLDLALLRIAGTLDEGDLIRPISLASFEMPIRHEKFWSTYWPRLIVQDNILSPTANERIRHNSMRISTQVMIPWTKCMGILQTWNISLDQSNLCLEPIISHHSPCMPDPGAPIVAEDILWGITSGWTSDECLEQPSPTLFTQVSTPVVRSWVDSIIQDM